MIVIPLVSKEKQRQVNTLHVSMDIENL